MIFERFINRFEQLYMNSKAWYSMYIDFQCDWFWAAISSSLLSISSHLIMVYPQIASFSSISTCIFLLPNEMYYQWNNWIISYSAVVLVYLAWQLINSMMALKRKKTTRATPRYLYYYSCYVYYTAYKVTLSTRQVTRWPQAVFGSPWFLNSCVWLRREKKAILQRNDTLHKACRFMWCLRTCIMAITKITQELPTSGLRAVH